MRGYSLIQIVGFVLALFLPPVAVWFAEGFGVDFWLNVLLTVFGYILGSIHSTYVWAVWLQRKWQTHHGKEVTNHPFLIFSKEFEERSRWKGNGQDGVFGYFDDNIKGADKPGQVGGEVDVEKAKVIPPKPTAAQSAAPS